MTPQKTSASFIDLENTYFHLLNSHRLRPAEALAACYRILNELRRSQPHDRVLEAVYADFDRLPNGVQRALLLRGYQPRYVASTPAKSSADIELALDAMEARADNNITTFELVTGDRDLLPIVRRLCTARKEVHIFSFESTLSQALADFVSVYPRGEVTLIDDWAGVDRFFPPISRGYSFAEIQPNNAVQNVLSASSISQNTVANTSTAQTQSSTVTQSTTREGREGREGREPRERREARDREGKEHKEPKEGREHKEGKDHKEGKEHKEPREKRSTRESRAREREAREAQAREARERDGEQTGAPKEARDPASPTDGVEPPRDSSQVAVQVCAPPPSTLSPEEIPLHYLATALRFMRENGVHELNLGAFNKWLEQTGALEGIPVPERSTIVSKLEERGVLCIEVRESPTGPWSVAKLDFEHPELLKVAKRVIEEEMGAASVRRVSREFADSRS